MAAADSSIAKICEDSNGALIPNNQIDWPGFGPLSCSLWYNPSKCTISTCPASFRQIQYEPSLAGNAFYLAIFCLVLVAQLFLGIRYKTWGFLAGMIGGLGLEILGYLARVKLHDNPFSDSWFKIYLVGLTIAPAFLSASIYLCLSRIIVIYGRTVSRLRPATYTITFISFDLFSLVLQAVGGAIAASTDDRSSQQAGINIMIAGLAFQVFSLFFFMCLCADFGFSAYRKKSSLDPAHAKVRNSTSFKAFQLALFAATIFIFVRSCFRVAELKEGFDGRLANDEVTFMILEGAMIILAVISLTIFHPGTCFQGSWHQANFSIRASKDRARAQNAESHEVNDYGKKSSAAASGTPSPA